MNPHEQLDQLSAYLDDELEAGERAALEAHLAQCEECRATVTALRATIADVRALPELSPSEQESWALRSRIAHARRRGARIARWSAGAGAAAASVVAVLAITLGGGSGEPRLGGDAERGVTALDMKSDAERPGVVVQAATYDASSARELFTPAPDGDTAATGTFGARSAAADDAPAEASNLDAGHDGVARCERSVFGGELPGRPIRYVAATWEGHGRTVAAFFLVYEVPPERPERLELWVLGREGCETLHFAQRAR